MLVKGANGRSEWVDTWTQFHAEGILVIVGHGIIYLLLYLRQCLPERDYTLRKQYKTNQNFCRSWGIQSLYVGCMQPLYDGKLTTVVTTALNTLRPKQNGCHFADDTFKRILLNENVPIKTSMKFVPKGPINNIPALIQIMAWHRPVWCH